MKTSQRTKAKSLERIHKTKGNTDRTRVAYSMTTGKNAEVLESLLQMWMAGKKNLYMQEEKVMAHKTTILVLIKICLAKFQIVNMSYELEETKGSSANTLHPEGFL